MGAEHFLALVGNEVGADKLPQPHDLGFQGVDRSPRGTFEVSADRHQAGEDAGGVENVDVMLYRVAPLKDRGLSLGIHPGGPTDHVGGNPGYLLYLRGRVRLGLPHQVLEPVSVLFHESLVVKRLLPHDADDPQGERLGRAGTKLEPEVGPPGKLRLAGVDDDHPGAALQLGGHLAVDIPLLVGGGKVAAPEKDQPGRMVEVGDGIEAAGVQARDFPSGMAYVLDGDHVR